MHYLHSIAIADLPLPTGRAALNDDNLKHVPRNPVASRQPGLSSFRASTRAVVYA